MHQQIEIRHRSDGDPKGFKPKEAMSEARSCCPRPKAQSRAVCCVPPPHRQYRRVPVAMAGGNTTLRIPPALPVPLPVPASVRSPTDGPGTPDREERSRARQLAPHVRPRCGNAATCRPGASKEQRPGPRSPLLLLLLARAAPAAGTGPSLLHRRLPLSFADRAVPQKYGPRGPHLPVTRTAC
jgi:hypothetical protein